jgi:hypothetical protein
MTSGSIPHDLTTFSVVNERSEADTLYGLVAALQYALQFRKFCTVHPGRAAVLGVGEGVRRQTRDAVVTAARNESVLKPFTSISKSIPSIQSTSNKNKRWKRGHIATVISASCLIPLHIFIETFPCHIIVLVLSTWQLQSLPVHCIPSRSILTIFQSFQIH